jgi:hypothetical protein
VHATPYDAASSPWPPLRPGACYVDAGELATKRAAELAARLELATFLDEVVDGEVVRFFRWQEGVSAARVEPLPLGLGDPFGDIIATPQGAAAWNTIQAQLTQEGASELDKLGAQTSFTNAFDQLTGQFGVDAESALNAATQYTLQAQTIAGAVSQVQGLIAAANNPATATADLINGVTGTIVAIAVAAGASAGVGGAIVAAVAAVVTILQSVGWIPQPPQGATIPGCAGRIHIPQPVPASLIIIGCVVGEYGSADQAKIATAKNAGWRRFPEKSPFPTLGPGVDCWFEANTPGQTRAGPCSWGGGQWSGDGDARLVDLAWPQYHHLECEAQNYLPGPPGDFQRAFFAAWKFNRELELNGQKAADDWQVLLHVIQVWNRAHPPVATYTFQPRGSDTDFMPASADCSQYSHFGPYVSYLASDLAARAGAGQPTSVTINTGPRKVGNCGLFGTCGTPGGTGAASSSSAAPAIAAVAVLGGLAAAWLYLGKPLSFDALKYALGKVL